MKHTKLLLSSLLFAGVVASAQTLVTVNGQAITQKDVDK